MAGLTKEQRAQRMAEAMAKAERGETLTDSDAKWLNRRPEATDTAESETAPVTVDESARLSVIARRQQNPFGNPSRTIPLQGQKRNWVVRTFVADPEHPDRHYDAVHRLGYVPLERSDLAVSPESIGYSVSTDGRIVRGQHGAEVLMAIPAHEYAAIQKAKSDANIKKMASEYTRSEVANATAKEMGSEAGDAIHNHFSQREIVEHV